MSWFFFLYLYTLGTQHTLPLLLRSQETRLVSNLFVHTWLVSDLLLNAETVSNLFVHAKNICQLISFRQKFWIVYILPFLFNLTTFLLNLNFYFYFFPFFYFYFFYFALWFILFTWLLFSSWSCFSTVTESWHWSFISS